MTDPSPTRRRSNLARPGPLILALLVTALVAPVAGPAAPAVAADLPAGRMPLDGPVVRAFDPPAERWQAGHRGVDVAGEAGSAVVAAADGTVTFAGPIAGRGVLVVSHGAVRTTYEPVEATVTVGARVRAGERIGTLRAGHRSCPEEACLHWGLVAGRDYLDPLSLVMDAPARVRLVGAEDFDAVARAARERARRATQAAATGSFSGAAGAPVSHAGPASSASGWVAPATGPVTSPFGMRVHPVTGIYKLHDGTDYGAACGAPIRSPLPGTITAVVWNAAYGWRAMIDHGTVDGRHLTTSMNHAGSYRVHPGQQVRAGEVIGEVGTTGWSTGCHLHVMAWVDGRLIDPATVG